jgi:O-acetyl-ADP-ribose deacetylase (regulator of RNase III)
MEDYMVLKVLCISTIAACNTLSLYTDDDLYHRTHLSSSYCFNGVSVIIRAKPNYDITHAQTEAIVNPANEYLQHAGGVAAAISEAAGPQLQEWSNRQPKKNGYAKLRVGWACISPAFDLKKRGITYIIHTVGPDFRDPKQRADGAQTLYDAWYHALYLADKNTICSIAFPSISSGIFDFPLKEAAQIAASAIKNFIFANPQSSLKAIHLMLWPDTYAAYDTAFRNLTTAK